MSTPESTRHAAEPHHYVYFSGTDASAFTRKVGEYLWEGLRRGEGVLVIATEADRDSFARQLRLLGANLDRVIGTRQLVLLDSAEMLSGYLVDGQPDWALFEQAVSSALQAVRPCTEAGKLRAYGDMVGLLWKDRKYPAAVRVEEYWNRLLAPTACQLFCGYPIDLFERGMENPEIQALCRTHTRFLSADEHGDIESAVDRAAREVLGAGAAGLLASLPPKALAGGAGLPRAEAKVLQLWEAYPESAAEVLSKARQHCATEKWLRTLIENSSDAVCITDANGRIQYAGTSTIRVLGHPATELIGRDLVDLVCAADREQVRAVLQAVLWRPRSPVHAEARLEHQDGSTVWMETTVSSLQDESERNAIVVNFQDITERKAAEEALRLSQDRLAARERHLRTVLDSLPECVKVLGSSGELLEINRGGVVLLEAGGPDQILGRCFYELICEHDRAAFQELNETVFQGGPGGALEYTATGLMGTQFRLETRVSPLRNEAGHVIGALSATRDVTAQRQAELARLRLSAIVESSDDAIISKDLNGRITSWNKAAERMFGYTEAEALGQPVAMLAAPDHRNEMPGILDRIRQGESVDHYETIRRKKNGETFSVSLTVSPIRNASGRIIGASKIARDITERKQAQELLQRTNAALRQSSSDLEHVAHAAAHDLQEPIRMVNVYSQMLQRYCGDSVQGEAAEYLEFITSGATRMQSVVSDLLAYTEAANTPQAPDHLSDTNQALRMALSTLNEVIDQSGATITCDELPPLRIGESFLVQLFQNLVSNAIKYRGVEPPRIHITAVPQGSHRKICVRDNGLGIAPAYTRQIFGLFKRLHRTHEYSGTGIGLALCQRIVERAGGQIWAESEGVGHGATFYFALPGAD